MERRLGAWATLVAAAAVSATVATGAPAAASEVKAPPPPPEETIAGMGWDTGFAYVVAAVSRGPFGENVAKVFPWAAIERCVTPKMVFDLAAGDPFEALHAVDLGVPDGAHVAVVREVDGKPALAKGCVGKALLAAKPAVVPPGLARVSIMVLPRPALLERAHSAAILKAPATVGAAATAAVRTAAASCLGGGWSPYGPAPARTTGKLSVTIGLVGDEVVAVRGATGRPASKSVLACLGTALVPSVPAAPASAPAPGKPAKITKPVTATFDLFVTAGGVLLVDDPPGAMRALLTKVK